MVSSDTLEDQAWRRPDGIEGFVRVDHMPPASFANPARRHYPWPPDQAVVEGASIRGTGQPGQILERHLHARQQAGRPYGADWQNRFQVPDLIISSAFMEPIHDAAKR